jgi:tRNA A37 threonylcarbamoyladenosine modification protein TsaB
VARGWEAVTDRPVLALIDARRRQVFAALYAAVAKGDAPGRPMRPLWEPAVMDPELLLERIVELDRAPVSAGDWAIRCRRELENAGAEVPPPDSGLHSVSALYVCRLSVRVSPVAPEHVYPVYLRLPDAEINKRLAEKQTG